MGLAKTIEPKRFRSNKVPILLAWLIRGTILIVA